MSRVLCQQCQRPEKACICTFTVHIDNDIPVLVLQHPSEVKQSKGTVSLLQQSLSQCQVIVGEDFTDNEILAQYLTRYADSIALLYPSEQALELNASLSVVNSKLAIKPDESTENEADKLNEIKCIIILDGTWKKAYRMYMLNPNLHTINHIALPQGIESLYQIRKTKKDGALSSLEACCHALARLENKSQKYQILLNSFIQFNQFQQSFNESMQ
ncbi:DTW domain-containing protein [Colwellia sp. Arc7-635]|uniref:tRNA-uridine aminocarboxypropyltransferase n=1 Tax=Colwellia sp. Arc7-635 TaxID=2497879 RepID=UPI000F84F521|nr:tRNA-uridine aminocarboxypropyltransferase [Colwellia sp. Arc7-635]AZQ84743.1 DTW domain-containing protein [Colwellia sp. Arc7-635]